MVELVVDNPSQRPDYLWMRSNVEHALRQLSANLIRVTRGAGAPHMLAEQAGDLLKAFQEHRDKIGHWPTSTAIHDALAIRQEHPLNENHDLFSDEEQFNDERYVALRCAEETIISGALRIAAARQIDSSPLQLTKGHDEMLRGVRAREEALASRFDPKKATKQRAERERWTSGRNARAEQEAVETEKLRREVWKAARELGVPDGGAIPWKKITPVITERGYLESGYGIFGDTPFSWQGLCRKINQAGGPLPPDGESEKPLSSIPLSRKDEMTVLARKLLESYGRYHRVARELWNRGFRKANGGQFSTQEIRDMLGGS